MSGPRSLERSCSQLRPSNTHAIRAMRPLSRCRASQAQLPAAALQGCSAPTTFLSPPTET